MGLFDRIQQGVQQFRDTQFVPPEEQPIVSPKPMKPKVEVEGNPLVDVPRFAARQIASFGLDVAGVKEATPKGLLQRIVLGSGPIASVSERLERARQASERIGVPSIYSPFTAAAGVFAGTALDITPFGGGKKKVVGKAVDSIVAKVRQFVDEARPIRVEQNLLYREERKKRLAQLLNVGESTAGERGFFAELSTLRGELPKAQYETLRGKLQQGEVDTAMELIKNTPELSPFETVTARTGFLKLIGGSVPTPGELDLLEKTFGKEFVQTVKSKRSVLEKLQGTFTEAINLPRTVMASFDLSAPLRQGLFLIGKPKQWSRAFLTMFKSFGSEKYYNGILQTIKEKPLYQEMVDARLSFTDLGGTLTNREEQFLSSWAEKIPIAGKAIRASGRAYTGFLNKLRADVFEDLATKAQSLGKDINYDDLAKFINAASGRGSLGAFERAAPLLNGLFFSPRLLASRLNLLNPKFYLGLDPFVRKEALKATLTTAGIAMSVLGLAKMGGADVETDPRNADWAKIKIGNTRFDILGGFQQPIRLAAQLISGKIISSTTGKEMVLGEGFRPLTRLDVLTRFFENKESPVASFITGFLRGETSIGEKFIATDEVVKRFIPMAAQDLIELKKENPDLLPYGLLALFGVGVQTYGPSLTEEEKQYLESLPEEEGRESKKSLEELKVKKAEQDITKAHRSSEAERLLNEWKSLPAEQANEQSRRMKKQDPELFEMIKNKVEEEQLGLNVFDKQLKKLNIKNGNRAEAIYAMLLKMPTGRERNLYVKELRNKKVITDEVYTQLQKLQQTQSVTP